MVVSLCLGSAVFLNVFTAYCVCVLGYVRVWECACSVSIVTFHRFFRQILSCSLLCNTLSN